MAVQSQVPASLAGLLNDISNDFFNKDRMFVAADVAADYGFDTLARLLQWLAAVGRISRPTLFTGSRCYGTPKPDSDWDWVRWCPQDEFLKLKAFADVCVNDVNQSNKTAIPKGDAYVYYPNNDRLRAALRFGPVNLIVVDTSVQWVCWRDGTKMLLDLVRESGVPRTRNQAVAEFQRRYNALRRGRANSVTMFPNDPNFYVLDSNKPAMRS